MAVAFGITDSPATALPSSTVFSSSSPASNRPSRARDAAARCRSFLWCTQDSAVLHANRANCNDPVDLKRALILAFVQVACILGLMGVAIAGFVIAGERLKASKQPQTVGREDTNGNSNSASLATPAIIIVLFVLALVVLTFCLWRVVLKTGRAVIYNEPRNLALTEAHQDGTYELQPLPGRFAQIIFGPPPPDRRPVLPDYESALKQAARQQARRRARELGVSAGRRGRENIGTGDAEDLGMCFHNVFPVPSGLPKTYFELVEIVRLDRMGSLPPVYRSEDMRKSTVLLKGAKLPKERRLSRASMFSASTVDGDGNTSEGAPSPTRTITSSRIASFVANFADRFSFSSSSGPPSPNQISHSMPSIISTMARADEKSKDELTSVVVQEAAASAQAKAAKPPPTRSRFYQAGKRSSSLASLHSSPPMGRPAMQASHSLPVLNATSISSIREEEDKASDDFELSLTQISSDLVQRKGGEGVV